MKMAEESRIYVLSVIQLHVHIEKASPVKAFISAGVNYTSGYMGTVGQAVW